MLDLLKIPISKKLLVMAILARVLIMPFLYHPDIKTYSFQSSFLGKGVLNIYEFLSENKKNLPLKEEFVYQPLAYLFWGSYLILVKPLLGADFEKWLWNASPQSLESPEIFRYLFLLKLPLLFFDLLMAFLLASLVVESKKKFCIFSLWLFNPLTLFVIYAYAGFDIIVACFVIVALLMALKGRLVFSAFWLAVAGLFKAYPLLFLPLILFQAKNFKEFLSAFIASVGTFFLFSLPFLSEPFVKSGLASGLMNRIFLPSIELGFGIKIIVPVFLLSIIYFLSIGKRNSLDKYFFFVGLALISFIHFHIQWLIWILPFFALFWIKEGKNKLLMLFWLCFIFVIPFFYDDKQMTVSLFSLFSRYFSLLPTPFAFVQKIYDPYSWQSLLQTLSSSLAVLLIWKDLSYQEN